jgi:hypothetical protein
MDPLRLWILLPLGLRLWFGSEGVRPGDVEELCVGIVVFCVDGITVGAFTMTTGVAVGFVVGCLELWFPILLQFLFLGVGLWG